MRVLQVSPRSLVFVDIKHLLSPCVEIQNAFQEIRKVLGEIPILSSEQRLLDDAGGDEDEDKQKEEAEAKSGKPRVLADGTYATETAYTSTAAARLEAVKAAAKPPLRSNGLSTFESLNVCAYGMTLRSSFVARRLLHWCCPCFDAHETRPSLL